MAWTAHDILRAVDLPGRDQVRARMPQAGESLGLAAVRDAITDEWMGTAAIAERAGVSLDHARDMLKLLVMAGEVEMRKVGNNFEWRRA
ncbi:MAG: hypothetical protein NUV51_01865 [Sulfuricaulis sp.]|nr:hypothetical protein [Sulfuricaulis sp.]